MADELTHFDEAGRAKMVDVSDKPVSMRSATAEGRVLFSKLTYERIIGGVSKKGDIASIAELAGIMGAKRTADLIPLCHPLPLTGLNVEIKPDVGAHAYVVTASVKTTGKTGVEMEALTAVTTACLTIYDMAKAVDKSMIISDIRLVEKSGGVSGDYQYKE